MFHSSGNLRSRDGEGVVCGKCGGVWEVVERGGVWEVGKKGGVWEVGSFIFEWNNNDRKDLEPVRDG